MFCERCPHRARSAVGGVLSRRDRQVGKPPALRRFARREVVLREGEVLEGLFCIRSGLLKRSVGNPQGNRKILEILGPSDLVGIESISGNGYRAAETIALEPSELCFFRRGDLPELINGEAAFALTLAEWAVERMRRAERGLADLALKSARERLAGAILSLGRRYGKRTARGIVLDLPVTRGELANLAGIAPATASRLLHELKDAGLVRTRGRSLLIVRLDRLKEENGPEFDQDQTNL